MPSAASRARAAIVAVPAPAERPFDRLRRLRQPKRESGFLDLRTAHKPRAVVREDAPVSGHVGEHDGRTEYWISDTTFKEIVGGAREERTLREQLFTRGLLATDRRGERVSLVVKRALPNGSRPNFVVLRSKASGRAS